MKPSLPLLILLLVAVLLASSGTTVAGTITPPPKDWVYWVNEAEGLGATFPGTPERVDISTAPADAHGYIFTKQERNLVGATFTIMVEQLPAKLTSAQQIRYLELKNSGFIKQMSIGLAQKSNWASFGKDRKRLLYKFKYKQEGIFLTAYGFWIIDGLRVIKVGVAYTDGLSAQKVAETLTFPDSFFLIFARKQR